MATAAGLAVKKGELAKVARLVRQHKTHLVRRDELIVELAGRGVPRQELAALALVSPARISQTIHPNER